MYAIPLKRTDRRIVTILVLLLGLLISSCTNNSSKNEADNLVVGGLYISQNDDGSFGASKILALDEFAVHVRMYSDEFETKPEDLNSADLNFLIGHAPMGKTGFLLDQPELLKVEKVSEEELEGYHLYLDAMKNR